MKYFVFTRRDGTAKVVTQRSSKNYPEDRLTLIGDFRGSEEMYTCLEEAAYYLANNDFEARYFLLLEPKKAAALIAKYRKAKAVMEDLTKASLDSGIVESFENGCGDHIYTSVVDGVEFSYVKQDEILRPEYSKGAYRVSLGDCWYPDCEFWIYD